MIHFNGMQDLQGNVQVVPSTDLTLQ